MESKLNALGLETYSAAFTDRVANNFFARHEKISGEQILHISPVQQVNLFIIKNLFEAWQQEASRLRSPYFNYNHPKVQEAQKMYMNTLSRHISIAEPEFKHLLKKSVQEALHLLFSPITFIGKVLEPTAGKPEKTAEVLRYVKMNQPYAKEAKSILNRQDVTNQYWIEALQNSLLELEMDSKLTPEAPQGYLQQFGQVLPLTPTEILRDEEISRPENEDEDTDFFSSITGTLDDEDTPTPTIQPTQAKEPDEERNFPTVADSAPRHATFRRDEPDFSNKAPQINVSQPPVNDERQQKTLNDRLKVKSDQKPQKQPLPAPAEKPNLATVHAKKKAGTIRSSITLNQRFMFTNELFNGDTQAFNKALDELDGFHSYTEALQYTMRQYARIYDWEEDSEATLEFLQILQNRFA